MREYDHYIFDLDLTLFDTKEGLNRCYEKALERIDRPYEEALCDELAKESFHLTKQRFHMSREEYEAFKAAFFKESKYCMTRMASIYPDAEEILPVLACAGKRLSIVSCKSRVQVRRLLRKAGISNLFACVVGEGDYKLAKPDPEPILICMAKTPIVAENSVYIGDSPNDMASAESANIDHYLIDRSGNGDIASLAELAPRV